MLTSCDKLANERVEVFGNAQLHIDSILRDDEEAVSKVLHYLKKINIYNLI